MSFEVHHRQQHFSDRLSSLLLFVYFNSVFPCISRSVLSEFFSTSCLHPSRDWCSGKSFNGVSRVDRSTPTSIDWSQMEATHLPNVKDSECETLHVCTSNAQVNLRDPTSSWLEPATLPATVSRWLRMSLGRHVQSSSFPETFEHFRLVCDLESSSRAGHVHTDRPPSQPWFHSKTGRAQDTVIHTNTFSSFSFVFNDFLSFSCFVTCTNILLRQKKTTYSCCHSSGVCARLRYYLGVVSSCWSVVSWLRLVDTGQVIQR